MAARLSPEEEQQARNAAFAFIAQHADDDGHITHKQLREFTFRGQRIHLKAPVKGIHKPAGFRYPLSIFTTAPEHGKDPQYKDVWDDATGSLHYKMRAGGPDLPINRALRDAMEAHVPVIYLRGIRKGVGVYIASIGLLLEALDAQEAFAVGIANPTSWRHLQVEMEVDPRAPKTRAVATRPDQAVFRRRVLSAYQDACALCRLKQQPLLEAAHIKPHAEGGEPIIPNGLAMCNLHHRAFDTDIIGIRPKLHTVEVRKDVLNQTDGPMLRHGLQGFDGQQIWLPPPRKIDLRPDETALEERYERFRKLK